MLGLGNSLSNILVPAAAASSFENEWSINLDGTNDFIEIENNFYATFRDSFAISMWFKTPPSGEGLTYILGLDQDSANDYTYFYIRHHDTGTHAGKIHIRLQTDGYALQNYTAALSDETWYHLVYTVQETGSGTNSVIDVYINGAADTTSELGTITGTNQSRFTDTDTTLSLGRYGSAYGNIYYHDFAMFSSYLDAANVAAMYNSGTPINLREDDGDYDNSENLVVYYKMDEGTGIELADSSANSNVGNIANGGAWEEVKPS